MNLLLMYYSIMILIAFALFVMPTECDQQFKNTPITNVMETTQPINLRENHYGSVGSTMRLIPASQNTKRLLMNMINRGSIVM